MEQLQNVNEVKAAIQGIIALRREASQSDPDRGVAMKAIRAAKEVFEKVPLAGAPRDYCTSVLSKMKELMDGYYDSDGEYSAGIGDIGSVAARVEMLLRRVGP